MFVAVCRTFGQSDEISYDIQAETLGPQPLTQTRYLQAGHLELAAQRLEQRRFAAAGRPASPYLFSVSVSHLMSPHHASRQMRNLGVLYWKDFLYMGPTYVCPPIRTTGHAT